MTKANDELAEALWKSRALAAEATIEQVRGLVADWDNVSRINLELALANADTSALARHDAEVAARALKEVIEHFQKDGPATFYRWMDSQGHGRARAAEKRAEL